MDVSWTWERVVGLAREAVHGPGPQPMVVGDEQELYWPQ